MRKLLTGLGVVLMSLFGFVGVAAAQVDPVTVVTDASTTLSTTLLDIAAAIVPSVIAIVAVGLGLRMAIRFFRRAAAS